MLISGIKRIQTNIFVYLITSLLLISCGDPVFRDFSGAGEVGSSSGHHVKGYVAKGPFVSGGNVTAYSLDQKGKRSLITGNLTVDEFGEFSINLEGISYIELSAKGHFFDEITGKTSSQGVTLSGISRLDENTFETQENLNVFTSMEARRVRYLLSQGEILPNALKQAENELTNFLASSFGCSSSVNSSRVDVFNRSVNLNDQAGNSCLLAFSLAVLQDQNQFHSSTLTTFESILTEFESSGTLSSNTLDLLFLNIEKLNPARIVNNFKQDPKFAQHSLADIDVILDTDRDGVSNKFDNDDDGDGDSDAIDIEPYNKSNNGGHQIQPVLIFVYIEGLEGEVQLTDLNAVTQGNAKHTFNKNGKQFLGNILSGASYNLEIVSQPENQTCTLEKGTGIAGVVTIENLFIHCDKNGAPPIPQTFQLGGTVKGLEEGDDLLVSIEYGEQLRITENGFFSFDERLAEGSTYNIFLVEVPLYKECKIENESGDMEADVSNVFISCGHQIYDLGGEVSGLSGSMMLSDGLGNSLSLEENGLFSFPAASAGSHYEVAVTSQPDSQECVVENGSGTIFSDILSVSVNCSDLTLPEEPLIELCEAEDYQRIFDMDFEEPIHHLGSVVSVDATSNTPTDLVFGDPRVVLRVDGEGGQALHFKPNEAGFLGDRYDQIRLTLSQGVTDYFIQFDAMISYPKTITSGSTSQFTMHVDANQVRPIRFLYDHSISAKGSSRGTTYNIASFNSGEWNRFNISIDIESSLWKIYMNNILLHEGYFDTYNTFDDYVYGDVRAIRFSTSETPTNVYLDNVVVDAANCTE